MKLRFITTNAGKAREVAALLAPAGLEVERVDRRYTEIQADGIEDVVAYAAGDLARDVRPPWFIDDSGLFIRALKGFPGVYSAHAYGTIGPQGLLRLLRGAGSRAARFETALLFHDGRASRTFRGACGGTIARAPRGAAGFGFDPIFVPSRSRKTFAEMSLDEKNRVSHRARAVRALADYLARGSRRHR